MTQRFGPAHPVVWIAGFIAALIAIGGFVNRNTVKATHSQASTTAQTTESVEPPTTSLSVSDVGGEDSAATFVPSRTYLTEMSPVSISLDIDRSPAQLAGKSYGNSLVFTCDLYCDESASLARAAYNLGHNYSSFSTVAGVLDTAPNTGETATFTVFVDGDEKFSGSIAFGEPVPISITGLRGSLRLELQITTGNRNVSPLEAGVDAAGGETNSFPHAAWGDPYLSA